MKNILYLSLVDWFWIKQRPHHICEGLSNNYKVIFFNQRSFRNNSRLNNSHKNLDLNYTSSSFNINENLKVINKRIIPLQGKIKIIKKINSLYLKRELEKLDSKYHFETIIITHPNDVMLLSNRLLNNKTIVYDCMDNYKKFPGVNESETKINELKLSKLASKIIVTSHDLYDEIIKYNLDIDEKVEIINNGVDVEKFNYNLYKKEEDVELFKNDSNRKVCYVGTISNWVDLDLIKNVADNNLDISFYFIGPIDENLNIEKYKKSKNMIFPGVQPYESIPGILKSVDITIMPFILNDLVLSVNPVKIYEYLAMGKPVIATEYSETKKFGNLINLYKDSEEFQKLLEKLLTEGNSESEKNRMIEFANINSWENRVKVYEEYM